MIETRRECEGERERERKSERDLERGFPEVITITERRERESKS